MKGPEAPHLDERRTPDFSAELRERARAWIPSWGLADGERDFGRALLEIAARFSAEVAERLDSAGEKMRRGFLDFLAVRGKAARPARMPVVFKLADAAREPVFAPAPVQMQVAVDDAAVIFETETDVRLLPGSLQVVAGIDADKDAVYLPPPGLSNLKPEEPAPAQWQLKSFAAAGATTLQLDPEAGLVPDLVLEAAGQQYRITKVDKELVQIDPPLTSDLAEQAVLRKVTAFAPFDDKTRDRQQHALYLGHLELLDIKTPATISIVGAQSLRDGVTWQYRGKVEGSDDEDWQELKVGDPQDDALQLEKEKKGEIVPFELVKGKKSRWIRGIRKNVPQGVQQTQLDELSIGINRDHCGTGDRFPDDEKLPPPVTDAEAFANNTPLVLNNVFYPLGREPRQFDAFYLGSAEAFSKAGADVLLQFHMGDPSLESLGYLRSGQQAHQRLAGVGGDGLLYLLNINLSTGVLTRDDNGPLRPPSPAVGGAAVMAPPASLDPSPPYRPAIWTADDEILIAVSVDGVVWVWHETVDPKKSGWDCLGEVKPVDDPKKLTGLVHLQDGAKGQLFALREGKLFVRDLAGAAWTSVETTEGANTIALQTIAPILLQNGSIGPGDLSEGLVGVDAGGTLYRIAFDGKCTTLLDGVAVDVIPAAVALPKDPSQPVRDVLVAAATGNNELVAIRSFSGNVETVPLSSINAAAVIGRSIDVNLHGGLPTFALSLQKDAQTTALALWKPFLSPLLKLPSVTTIPPGIGVAGGAPALLPTHVIVPDRASQLLVAALDANGILQRKTTVQTALIASKPADQLVPDDKVAIAFDDGVTTSFNIAQFISANSGIQHGTETLYSFGVPSIGDKFVVYPAAKQFDNAPLDPQTLAITLDPGDQETAVGTLLLITTDVPDDLYVVDTLNAGVITVAPPLNVANPQTPPGTVSYRLPEARDLRLAPLLNLTSSANDWPASLLDTIDLAFPNASPERQRGTAFQVTNANPVLVALGEPWTTVPPDSGGSDFVVDHTVGDFKPQLGDTSSNPALSWEYANGTGWWKLDPLRDTTQNLKHTGTVRFAVPDDLRPMDVAGRTNYWIRARLVGGDYGKEVVTVRITPPPAGTVGDTIQTIERSSVGIRAPQVVKLDIAYRLCKGVPPVFVLTEDSLSMRDQSDANRTGGAVVEAFVPLGVMLGRLANPAALPEKDQECPPTTAAGAAPAAAPAPPATGRALFIGLAASPSGEPVNVLLLVDKENPYEQFAPMTIEALVADRFVPVVADDTTRALGESGLLSMSFAVEPTPRELFGYENLTWLRLSPRAGAPAKDWQPALRGAYLNAAFASAAETLTRELLGSSEGAPDLTLRLARPPLLAGTLELRVREPLSDEERKKLRAEDAGNVVNDANLTGDWVLWREVVDPADEAPDARVYALDEEIGEVRFGDGRHGAIPPIGRDSIVAFQYRRTELGKTPGADVPANAVTARTVLGLVSPIQTVETVIAADRAAGGAPPESDERVVRFGAARLRHHERAVTVRDLEDLALESSPDVVQARAFAGRESVRMIVVMRGAKPLPNAAQIRELRRLLLAAAPASLGATGVLRIEGPRIRRLRVVLQLRVASLDHAGEVARAVGAEIRALFDTAAGGAGGEGWALGDEPKEEDIARALLDTRHLEGIAAVELREVLADGSERRWKNATKRDELVMLDKDPVRIEFKTVEVIA